MQYTIENIKEGFKKNVRVFGIKNLGNETPLTYEELLSPRRKYFYDSNNGDQWRIVKYFGYPVSHLLVENVTQGGTRLIDLTLGDTFYQYEGHPSKD